MRIEAAKISDNHSSGRLIHDDKTDFGQHIEYRHASPDEALTKEGVVAIAGGVPGVTEHFKHSGVATCGDVVVQVLLGVGDGVESTARIINQ